MSKKATPEEIIAKLREVEIRLSQGETIAQAVRVIGVTEQTFYRWRTEYGGLRVGQTKRLVLRLTFGVIRNTAEKRDIELLNPPDFFKQFKNLECISLTRERLKA